MCSSAATNVMNGRVLETFGEEVEEGWAKIQETIHFNKRVDGDIRDVGFLVEVEGGP